MEGDFELGRKGWYTVQNVEPNEFLNNKLENDQYGIFYSVKFQGNADTYLWQAKAAPTSGDKVFGHLEKTSSGKSVKFKRAKKEDTPQEGGNFQSSPSRSSEPSKSYAPRNDADTQESIARSVALKAAVDLHASHKELSVPSTLLTADAFLAWLQGGTTKPSEPENSNVAQSSPKKEAPRDWSKVGKGSKSDEEMDAEAQSLYENYQGYDEPGYPQ